MDNKPTFAIILPVFNEEQNIRASLESILAQTFTNWVCYILNDCSTDNTEEICLEFVNRDSRFKYVKSEFKHYDENDNSTLKDKDMSGISNMINLGIELSDSEYIIRHDGDDEMLPERLQITYDWMNSHKDVDLAGFPLVADLCQLHGIYNLSGGNGDGTHDLIINKYEQLKNNYKPYHPTLCIRRESTFSKIKFAYRQVFDGCEDTCFYYHCLSHGCKIVLADTKPVEVYKNFKNHKNQYMIHDRIFEVYNNNYKHKYYDPSKEFTVILTFKNEGIEVEKTIISLLFTDQSINIILIDDASDDGYNYKELADIFGCFYYRNEVSQGCAGARNVGVKFVNTPYFMLMDAHMRFPIDDRDFSKRFINKLKEDPNQIVFCNTNIMGSNTDEDPMFRHYTNEDCISTKSGSAAIGACYNMHHDGKDWSSEWCYKIIDNDKYKYSENKDKELCVETVSIMGANYAMSVEWWNKIQGLNGLYAWGHDEPLLSLKTYLLGGKCVCFKNYAIGHLYRTKPSYGSLSAITTELNILFIQYLMSHDDDKSKEELMFNEYVERMFKCMGEEYGKMVMEDFNSHKKEYDEIKQWLWQNAVRTIDDIYSLQNRLS